MIWSSPKKNGNLMSGRTHASGVFHLLNLLPESNRQSLIALCLRPAQGNHFSYAWISEKKGQEKNSAPFFIDKFPSAYATPCRKEDENFRLYRLCQKNRYSCPQDHNFHPILKYSGSFESLDIHELPCQKLRWYFNFLLRYGVSNKARWKQEKSSFFGSFWDPRNGQIY